MSQIKDILASACEIARSAGALLLEGWGQALQIEYKGSVNLVTDYDRRAETLILNALGEEFPDHRVNGEEGGKTGPADSPYSWTIDPLDGTTNFAHGFPVFAVSLGLSYRDQGYVGVIYDPTRDELFSAAQGLGAFLNGERIQVSDTAEMDRALLATGFAYDRRSSSKNNVDNLARFLRKCQGIRRAGAAALDLAYVACGRLDGFWEMGLYPWDVNAGSLIVKEAGGCVTDFLGGHKDDRSGDRIVASNERIHQEMLDVLNSV